MAEQKQKTVMVVAAHPDDELLGAGGTLRKHVEAGDTVSCLILGFGAMARDDADQKEVLMLRTCAQSAAEIIGFSDITFGDFPDNAFDTVSLLSLTKAVETVLLKKNIDILYTHHEYDLNVDHRRTFEAVLTASRPCNAHAPLEIRTFETLSSTEWQSKDHKQFAPNIYVDIANTIEKKNKALQCYTSEMREYPHSRSFDGVRIQAQHRGLESGLKFVEAFRLIRKFDLT